MTAKMPPPDDDEDYSDFMDRCTDELDEDECQLIWDEERAVKTTASCRSHKTHTQENASGLEFVMTRRERRPDGRYHSRDRLEAR